jgi:chromosome segregation ATPase
VRYKKEHIKSNGRRLVGGGPRDLQKQQQQFTERSDIINELKNEIIKLTEEVQREPSGDYTGEQMDDEIRSAVSNAIEGLGEEIKNYRKQEKQFFVDLKEKDEELEKVKDKHSKEIKSLLKEHNEKLEKLTTSIIKSGERDVEDYQENDRPKIEAVFIDPLEKDAGKALEPFLDVKDISTNEKENMFDKVNKLKDILGKLPVKKIGGL